VHEHHVLTPRSARYFTFGPPATAASQVWFALHGYGQLARRFAARLNALDDGRRMVVVPEGLSRFYVDDARGLVGASWMTREDRLRVIDDYVRFLDTVAHAVLPAGGPTPPVHVLGFSQGSATACRWIERGTLRPARLLIWAGEVPPDLDWARAADRFRGVEVLLVAGDRDEFATAEALERHAGVLATHGVTHRTVRYPGDHSLDPKVLAELAGIVVDI
jgi:predicted esterase